MNTEDAATLIRALADTLDVPTQQLLGYYMARIPALWVQFGFGLLFALVLLATLAWAVRTMRARRIEWEKQQESSLKEMRMHPSFDPFFHGSAVAAVTSMVSGIMLFVVIMITADSMRSAITATMAPEAYAIDAVLRHLRD